MSEVVIVHFGGLAMLQLVGLVMLSIGLFNLFRDKDRR